MRSAVASLWYTSYLPTSSSSSRRFTTIEHVMRGAILADDFQLFPGSRLNSPTHTNSLSAWTPDGDG